jgi:hypothetical protein
MKMPALSLRLVLSGLLFLGLSARADDKAAEAKFLQASDLFKQRTDAAKVTQALSLVQAGTAEATSDELKYDLMCLHARLLYWKGTHTAGDANKITIHDQGVKISNEARELLEDRAEANYFSAAHLGRWAEAKGVIASLSKKKEIMETLEAIPDLSTKAGDGGEVYEDYGSDRILGRLYFKLPAFAGGSLATSLKHLETAYNKAPNNALNVVFYAESLASGNATQKAKAKQILDALLKKDPQTLHPDRIPETIEEFADARKLRAQLGQ